MTDGPLIVGGRDISKPCRSIPRRLYGCFAGTSPLWVCPHHSPIQRLNGPGVAIREERREALDLRRRHLEGLRHDDPLDALLERRYGERSHVASGGPVGPEELIEIESGDGPVGTALDRQRREDLVELWVEVSLEDENTKN